VATHFERSPDQLMKTVFDIPRSRLDLRQSLHLHPATASAAVAELDDGGTRFPPSLQLAGQRLDRRPLPGQRSARQRIGEGGLDRVAIAH
jgi:hypothetical protein